MQREKLSKVITLHVPTLTFKGQDKFELRLMRRSKTFGKALSANSPMVVSEVWDFISHHSDVIWITFQNEAVLRVNFTCYFLLHPNNCVFIHDEKKISSFINISNMIYLRRLINLCKSYITLKDMTLDELVLKNLAHYTVISSNFDQEFILK